MNHLIGAVGIALVFAASGASAQAPDCSNAASQAAMSICAAQALRASDAELNRTYNVVMARLSPDSKKALRDAQRAWMAFRDKECFFESNGNDGGSIAPMTVSYCAQALTEQRAKALAAFKTCEEGDLSCPR